MQTRLLRKRVSIALLLCFSANALWAQVSLAKIFSDNMVLQAHQPIKVWGSAAAGEKVKVTLGKNEKTINADKNGKWKLVFPAMDYGKPLTLKAAGKNSKVEYNNVLIGEVWLCSGQSNMAMTVNGGGGQVYNYKNEESSARYNDIRSFKVKPQIATKTGGEVEGEWVVCTPQTVGEFSAVGYFFARKIYEEKGVPVGIINSSWGGTDIETWISGDAFSSLGEKFKTKYKEVAALGVEETIKKAANYKDDFSQRVADDVGMQEHWYGPSFDASEWKHMKQPQEWSNTELRSFDGVAWFRYELNLSAQDAAKPGLLVLGKIDDNDITWINGIKVGETNGAGAERMYNVPAGVLTSGKNTIVVRIVDAVRGGGFTGIANDFYLKAASGEYSLAGDWSYKTTTAATDSSFDRVQVQPNLYHSLLYNGMIDALKDFSIKGVLWYQGENNASQAYDYQTLFPTLINDWRTKWNYDFPFYWVQLASFMQKPKTPPVTDTWAELREAQTLTLSVLNTAQAVITDIGDANDIHPKNKQDVGLRLADIALNKCYGKSNIVCAGPTYKSMRIDNNKIVIEFNNEASGLHTTSKYGYVEGFSIAGTDQKFVWANAKIVERSKVIVFTDQMENPVAVRYCWASNPDVNLFNSANLPAAPFRTDTWPLSSEK